MLNSKVRRTVSIALGLAAGALGCYGAYEFSLKLEGHVSYLVIAAPLVAAAAALIPPLAEGLWRDGSKRKSLCMWLALPPALATVFFAAAERVHVAKSGAVAERSALRSAVERAQAELTEAKGEAKAANAAADKTQGWKNCKATCLGTRATADRANGRVGKAETHLTKAQSASTAESPLTAPVWLLPAALDLIAFMMIWAGLTGPMPTKAETSTNNTPKPRRKATPRKVAARKPSRKAVVANDNVVAFPAA